MPHLHPVADAWTAIRRQLGRSVRDRRIFLEMTQADLARLSGLSRRRIQQIEAESEVVNPSLRVLYQIALSLDTTIVGLLSADQSVPRSMRSRSPK